MPINPLISLEGRTVNTANAGNNLVNIMQQSNANKAAQATAERQAQADARSVELHNIKLEEAATKKSKDKEESIILGAASIYDDLKNERFDVVEEKLLKRKSNIQSRIDAGETGLDTKDTDEALDALVNNPLGLLQASESANNEAIRRKLIAKPDKPQDQFTPIEDAEGNIVAQKNETTGKILSDPRADKQTTSEFERLLESSNMTEQKKSELRATRLTRLANGEKGMSLISDGAGGFALTQGNVASGSITGNQQGKREVELSEKKIGVEQFHNLVGETIELLEKNPDATTVVAAITKFGVNIAQEARALARNANIDIGKVNLDPDSFTGDFGSLAGASRAQKTMGLQLALALAVSAGQTGRGLSDKDLARFIDQTGMDESDPRLIIQNLKQLDRNNQENHKIRHQNVLPDQEFGGFGFENNDTKPVETTETKSSGTTRIKFGKDGKQIK